MYSRPWILLFVAMFLLMTLSLATESVADPSVPSKTWEVNVELQSPIYLPTPRPIPDVFFVLNNTTPDMVYRIELSQTKDPMNLAKEAYASTKAIPRDTYKLTPNALGPFPKGEDLGFTLGQWIAATGKGTYIEENGNATLNLTFGNLVPNGAYTIWYNRVTMPPNYKEVFTPIGTSDGSQNAFKADSKGNAKYNLKLKALPDSSNLTWENYVAMYVTKKTPIIDNITWTLIAVAYHSDGITHGPIPGEFGKTTQGQLVHLMYPKPIRTYEEWKNATVVAATTKTETVAAKPQEKQPGFEGIFAIIGLLAMAYIASGKRR